MNFAENIKKNNKYKYEKKGVRSFLLSKIIFDGQKKNEKKSIKSRFFYLFFIFCFFLVSFTVSSRRKSTRDVAVPPWISLAKSITGSSNHKWEPESPRFQSLSLSLSLSLKKINQSIEKKIRAPFFIEFFFGSEFDTNVGNMQIPGTGAWLSGWPADGAWLRCCSDKINQQQTTVWPIQFHQK